RWGSRPGPRVACRRPAARHHDRGGRRRRRSLAAQLRLHDASRRTARALHGLPHLHGDRSVIVLAAAALALAASPAPARPPRPTMSVTPARLALVGASSARVRFVSAA